MASKTTTDHNEIRTWVEERDGSPAMVKSTMDGEGGLLRIDFGEKEDGLEEVSWDDFFRVFDERGLAFLYEDETDGKKSRFFKFINKDSV